MVIGCDFDQFQLCYTRAKQDETLLNTSQNMPIIITTYHSSCFGHDSTGPQECVVVPGTWVSARPLGAVVFCVRLTWIGLVCPWVLNQALRPLLAGVQVL